MSMIDGGANSAMSVGGKSKDATRHFLFASDLDLSPFSNSNARKTSLR